LKWFEIRDAIALSDERGANLPINTAPYGAMNKFKYSKHLLEVMDQAPKTRTRSTGAPFQKKQNPSNTCAGIEEQESTKQKRQNPISRQWKGPGPCS